MEIAELARIVVDCGFQIHKSLGPGLSVAEYETLLADKLADRGISVERQKPIAMPFQGVAFDGGFRADLLVEGRLLVELKAVVRLSAVHSKHVRRYLRFLDLPLGLLINFGGATYRDGVKRIKNDDAKNGE